MNEQTMRKKLVDTAISYLGCKESDGSHKKIIDLYNSHKPLARGYKVKYTDAWCSTFASAMAIACGFTDIIPTECGCEEHIELFKAAGIWEENDAYVPSPGDYILYDWQDNGVGNNTGRADHIGIVVSVTGTTIKIIEGNISNSVGYRELQVNGKYIRGYAVPNYAGTKVEAPSTFEFKVGDIVQFTGTKHYVSSDSINGKTCKPGRAKITAISASGKHPVHLVAMKGSPCNVYGWVDTAYVTRESVQIAAGYRVKVRNGARTYTGGKLLSFVYQNTYDVISVNGDRVVIGKGKSVTAAMNKKDLTVV